MYPETTILKLFLEHNNWEKWNSYIVSTDFSEELQPFYNAVHSYHQEHTQNLSVADLGGLVYSFNPKKQEFNESILSTLDKTTINETLTIELIKKLKRRRVYRELSLKAYDAAEGKISDDDVNDIVSQLDIKIEEELPDPFVSGTLDELLSRTYKQPGLRWRLQCLNESLGSLRKGDFGFVFARPETGKTTFLASEISHMAEQTEGLILWFNNEEQGDKVALRVYQASLGSDLAQLNVNSESKEAEFKARTGGRIKIIDRASLHKNFVEQVCKKYSPALIIFDQIDKIQGFKADREDLMLGAIYIWARELAKKYCPVIGICQAGGTGENIRYLTMNHVANAHTAKQAEADWILGIGFLHDTGWEEIRFLNISKNKLQGDVDTNPKLRHGKMEVLIQPDIARYKDLVK